MKNTGKINVKKRNELKTVDINAVTNFIKDVVESSSDAEVYTDGYDNFEEDRVVLFR